MLGLVVLMLTFLAFPLWCMVGAVSPADPRFTPGATDADTALENQS